MKALVKNICVAAVVALGASSVASASNDFIVNGSFEENELNQSWKVFQVVDPWFTLEGAGIEIQQNSTIGGADAHDGTFYVELDSHNTGQGGASYMSNTAMGQVVDLDPGYYTLSFWYQPRTDNLNDNGILASVFGWDSNTDQTVGIALGFQNADNRSSVQPGWEQFFVNFTVTEAGDHLIQFAANGNENTLGGFIDSVSLTRAVPEPATWLMMILGFAMTAFSVKRRQKAVLA